MATANDVIRRAMRISRVLAVGQNPSAIELSDCLTILNQMLYSWGAKGVNFNLATLADSDTLAVPDDALMAIEYGLAMLIAPEFERPIDPMVAGVADEEFRRLQRDMGYVPVVDLNLPRPSSAWVDYA